MWRFLECVHRQEMDTSHLISSRPSDSTLALAMAVLVLLVWFDEGQNSRFLVGEVAQSELALRSR